MSTPTAPQQQNPTVYAQSPDQQRTLQRLEAKATALRHLPITNSPEIIRYSLEILNTVLLAPVGLGPMSEDYMQALFVNGQAALNCIQATIALYCSDNLNPDWQPPDPAILRDEVTHMQAGQEALKMRETCVLSFVVELANLSVEDHARLTHTAKILRLASGVSTWIRTPRSMRVLRLPELSSTDVNDEVRANLGSHATMAVIELARCLSARYCCWEVRLKGEKVPGTGDEMGEEMKKRWRAFPGEKKEEAWKAFRELDGPPSG